MNLNFFLWKQRNVTYLALCTASECRIVCWHDYAREKKANSISAGVKLLNVVQHLDALTRHDTETVGRTACVVRCRSLIVRHLHLLFLLLSSSSGSIMGLSCRGAPHIFKRKRVSAAQRRRLQTRSPETEEPRNSARRGSESERVEGGGGSEVCVCVCEVCVCVCVILH